MRAVTQEHADPVPTADRAGPGRWIADMALGVRFAVRARRSSWARLVLTAVGIALGVLVLLTAASVPHVVDAHGSRTDRLDFPPVRAAAGTVRFQTHLTMFRGNDITVVYVQPTHARPTHAQSTHAQPPLPPGLTSLPRPGTAVVSPALQQMLGGSAGSLLRPRFPAVTGTIAQAGLLGPSDLRAYVGARGLPARHVTRFRSAPTTPHTLPPVLWMLLVVGVVVLLFPVVVFLIASVRLSSAARDRRLAALRLLGADARQVRRIAAGEALLGAAVGLAGGVALFLALRPLAQTEQIAGVSIFASDLVPATPLLAVVVAVVPVITVGTVLFGLRDTVIEPLGVVRQATPPRRRLWWRLIVLALGVIALLRARSDQTIVVVVGAILLLSSVPLLLPWILQRVVGLLRRGTPSWELATARLALDSGTPSRVVSGVAVVLTGAIALFGLLLGAERSVGSPTPAYASDSVHLHAYLTGLDRRQIRTATAAVAGTTGIAHAGVLTTYYSGSSSPAVLRGSCEALRAVATLASCRDGDVFRTPQAPRRSGPAITVQDNRTGNSYRWQVPRTIEPASAASPEARGSLLATPAAMPRGAPDPDYVEMVGRVGHGSPDTVERVRDALAPLTWRVQWVDTDAPTTPSRDQQSLGSIRRGLYVGATLTLALAGASMLVLTLEQIADRRRPLAGLAAGGVPRWMLARSVLWQNALPLALAVAVSIGVGVALGGLALRIANAPVAFDAVNIAALAGIAVAVVAAATALTLPAVWQATKLTTLREE